MSLTALSEPHPMRDVKVRRKRKKRALLTGASGFIGSHLVGSLRQAGWIIGAIARPRSARALGADPRISTTFRYTGKTDQLCAAVDAFRPDVVFHLASLFLAQHRTEDVEALVHANILFGAQLLEGMRRAGADRLVNTGTSWQNGNGAVYDPLNLYAATKQAFEDIVQYYVVAAGLKCTTLRLFDSYGPGDTRKKLLRILLDTLRTGETLGMSPGRQVIDLAHVDDICCAFCHAGTKLMTQKKPGSSVYAVSGGQRMSLRDVVATLEKAAGKKLPVEFGTRPYREREAMVSWDGPPLPGWKPRIKLRDGFRMLLAEEGVWRASAD
jgi:nucleoside-diphosphate-sugar epimerase